MKTLEIIKEIGFTTDTNQEVTHIKITLSQSDIDRIKDVSKLVDENKLISAKICVGDFELLEDDEESNFRDDGIELIVFKSGTFYVYFQSKYTAEIQYESHSIDLDELKIK